jgi:hypothetical protein
MGFYVTSGKKKGYTTQDKEWAVQLFGSVRPVTTPNLDRWSKQFAGLRNKYPSKRIQKVLDWYCKNKGFKYCPVVRSVETFSSKFDSIKSTMDRYQEKHVVITKRTKKFLKLYRMKLSYIWEKDVQKEWLPMVQLSLDNGYKLKRIVQRCIKRLKKKARSKPQKYGTLLEVTNYLAMQYFNSPETFISDWIDINYRRLNVWQDWKRNPMSIMFSWDRQQFRKTLLQLVQCPEEVADAFIKEIRQEASKSN